MLDHEHGHGVGLLHVCPINNTKLMEPFLNTNFDGLRHDEVRGGQRHYGHADEQNDTAATATDLGTINFNRRTGMDASSTAVLDNFDYGWVTIVPDPFSSSSQTIRYEFRFPGKPRYVELTDIYGRGIRRTFND